MQDLKELDAHEQPSDKLRTVWKAVSKLDQEELLRTSQIDDPRDLDHLVAFVQAGVIPAGRVAEAHGELLGETELVDDVPQDVPIYYHPILPGLLIIPRLINSTLQKELLCRMLHRDLSNPNHQTNMHLHFNLPYAAAENGSFNSFFSYKPDSDVRFTPKNDAVHKPLSVKQVLDKRLHWVTLGGQYDWTNRVYPGKEPPAFPPDLARFLKALFPETDAQAAIVNFYSSGDTMMMHRDVSEQSDKGLISLSIGCDGLFMIAPDKFAKETPEQDEASVNDKQYLLLRLRSGDAIYMTGESRYAWHGVPKVLKGTCPDYLEDWPAGDGKYDEWKGWAKNKRINLNVRQMTD